MFLTLLELLVIGNAVAQVVEPEKCPDVEVVPNFDTDKYLGKWYEAVRSKNDTREADGKCITANYDHGKKETISYTTRQISIKTETPSSVDGYVKQEFPEKAKWSLFFPFMPSYRGAYWILDTDYTSYAVVWSCYDFGVNAGRRLVWILTREQNPPADVLEKGYSIIDKTNTSRQSLIKTDQVNCPKNNSENHFPSSASVLKVEYTAVKFDDKTKGNQD